MKISFQKINMYSRCGLQYYFRYIQGLKLPPTTAVVQGRACHKAAEEFYKKKFEEKHNPPLEFMLDTFSDELERIFTEEEIQLSEEEERVGKKKVQASLKDDGISMMRVYHQNRAVEVDPFLVEAYFEVPLGPIASQTLAAYDGSLEDVNLIGYVDLADLNGVIFDLKTKKKAPGKQDAESSQQLTAYALGYKTVMGMLPSKVVLDCLVNSKTPKLVSLASFRTQEDLERLLKRIIRIVDGIRKGVFIPPDQGHWACRYCGYRDFGICKEYLL